MRFLTVAVLCLSASGASAQVLFNQSPGNNLGGFVSDFANSGVNQQVDNFVLSSSGTVLSVRVWGFYNGNPALPPADNFTIRFFEQNNSQDRPQNNPLVQFSNVTPTTRTATILTTSGGATVYEYVFDFVTGVNLTGGLTYYLSIVNDTSSTAANDQWSWSTSLTGDNRHWSRAGNNTANPNWDLTTGDLAFTLNPVTGTTVPEPAALTMCACGAGLIWTLHRRSRKQAAARGRK